MPNECSSLFKWESLSEINFYSLLLRSFMWSYCSIKHGMKPEKQRLRYNSQWPCCALLCISLPAPTWFLRRKVHKLFQSFSLRVGFFSVLGMEIYCYKLFINFICNLNIFSYVSLEVHLVSAVIYQCNVRVEKECFLANFWLLNNSYARSSITFFLSLAEYVCVELELFYLLMGRLQK